MAFQPNKKALYSISAYITPGHEYRISAAIEATQQPKYSISAFIIGEAVAKKKLVGSVSLVKGYPDVFFGVQEPNSISLTIENLDQELTFIDDEEPYGRLIRIRRLDQLTGEEEVLTTGRITSFSVGDTININATSLNTRDLTTPFPRNRVYHENQDLPDEVGPLDLTVNFREARDLNVPIPAIISGRAYGVPLIAVKDDDVNQEYDFLIGETNNLSVEEVQWFSNANGWQPKFIVEGTAQGGWAEGIVLDALDAQGQGDDLNDTGYYEKMFVEIFDGKGRGQIRRITAYNETLKQATVAKPWTTTPDNTSRYRIKEFMELKGNVYFGRTAVRFGRPQIQGNAYASLIATVVKYSSVYKNALLFTENFDITSVWPRTGSPTLAYEIEDPFGANNAVKITAGTDSAPGVYQPDVQRGGYYYSWIFSVWLRTDSGRDVKLTIKDQAGNVLATSTESPTATWTRYTLQKTNPGTNVFQVWIEGVSFAEGETYEIFGPQMEKSESVSWYEPVEDAGQGMSWTPSEALREIITSPVWGLNRSVDAAEFDTAREVLASLYIKCQGFAPGNGGQISNFGDLINEISKIRGIRLPVTGNKYGIIVDTEQTSVMTIGTGDTIYKNIVSVSDVESAEEDSIIKKLAVNYGQRIRASTGEAHFPFRLTKTVNADYGEDVEEYLLLVGDSYTADRYLQWKAARSKRSQKRVEIVLGQKGRSLEAGDEITAFTPRRQVENLVLQSEDATVSPWTGTATAANELDPEKIAKAGASIAAGNQVSQTLSGSTTPDNFEARTGFFTVWLKSELGSTVDLTFGSSGQSASIQTEFVGKSWKQALIEREFLDTDTGSAYITVDNTGSNPVIMWGAQVCDGYLHPYIRTTDTAKNAQRRWQAIRIQASGIERTNITAIPYGSEIYDYTKSDFSDALVQEPDIDLRFTPPPYPTNITVPPDPPTPTSAAGVVWASPYGDTESDAISMERGESKGEVQLESWADIAFDMPLKNTVRVVVQIRLFSWTGSPISNSWTDVGTVTTSSVGLGSRAKVRATGLVPGRKYEVRAISFSSYGMTGISIDRPQFIARGDETPPDAAFVKKAEMLQGTGRNIEFKVEVDPVPEDFDGIELYRNPGIQAKEDTPNLDGVDDFFDSNTQYVTTAGDFSFNDSEFLIDGTTYYYFIRLVDHTKLQSGVVPVKHAKTQNTGILPIKIIDDDLEAFNVTAGKLTLGSGTDLLLVGGFEGTISDDWNLATPTSPDPPLNGGIAGSTTDFATEGSASLYYAPQSLSVRKTIASTKNPVSVTADAGYRLGVDMALGLESPGGTSLVYFYITVAWLNSSQTYISSSVVNGLLPHSVEGEWKSYAWGVDAPAAAAYAIVYIEAISQDTTNIYVDALKLVSASVTISGVDESGGTQRLIVTDTGTGAIVGYITITPP